MLPAMSSFLLGLGQAPPYLLTSAHHHFPSLQLLFLDAIIQMIEAEHATHSTLYLQVEWPRRHIPQHHRICQFKEHTYGDH